MVQTSVQQGRQYGGLAADERRDERRAKLLLAGRNLFGTVGYATTSINDICAEAELTKRYFYESFASSEALLIAVYEQVADQTQESVILAMAEVPDDLAAAARAGSRAFFEAVGADGRTARILLSEVLGVSPAVDAAYGASIEKWTDIIAAALVAHDYHGLDTELLAGTVWGLITGTALRWHLTDWSKSIDDVATMVGTVLTDIVAQVRPTD
jgi:AcrR family transcriptional regulator